MELPASEEMDIEKRRIIQEYGWEKFCRDLPAVVVPVVREFDSNTPEMKGTRVFVQKKWVDILADIIKKTPGARPYRRKNVSSTS